jgi:hypothetical protein
LTEDDRRAGPLAGAALGRTSGSPPRWSPSRSGRMGRTLPPEVHEELAGAILAHAAG